MSRESRPTNSRHTTDSSVPYVPQAESLILPDGPVGEEATELLNEFVHHHHELEDTPIGEDVYQDHEEGDKIAKAPWWKRPSPWWLLGIVPFTSIAMSATIAPRIEIYTTLACSVHKPDIFKQAFPVKPPYMRFGDDAPSVFSATVNMTVPTIDLGLDRVYLPEHDSNSRYGSVKLTASPSKPNPCATDPVVGAAVAKLTAVITASMGILSCVTTGWWGAFSDRHGRTRVMGISIVGLLLTDWNFILVAKFSKYMPGGYWFLLVGPIVEGCLGGMTSAIAAMHAYMADTSNESNRSRVFSLSLGLLFTGMAIGPTIGSLLIRATGQVLSVFYVAACMHLLYAFLVWFVIPESLPQARRDRSKIKYAQELEDTARDRQQNPAVGFLMWFKRLFAFLSPLTIFMPEVKPESGNRNPLKKPKRDWNLTLMALGYGLTISMMGSYSVKFQYAASQFGWTSETLGYWLSLIGATRAFFLTAVLPIAIKLFKPAPIIIELPAKPTETEPLLSRTTSHDEAATSSSPSTLKTSKKEIHSPAFDLGLARASLAVEIIAYTFMGLATTPLSFTVFGMLGSFGTGFSPAVQSVTLALYARRGGTESGRLFGALSVIQALCSQILGPSLYGLVYARTVATFPRAIFFVSVGTITASFILLTFVRLPMYKHGSGLYAGHDVPVDEEEQAPSSSEGTFLTEEPLVRIDGEDVGRSRKRQTPPLVTVTSPTN
ncbi:major facilitator superfamily domain-containing protein [Crucibulum laeve]|uniref:Major facilitator superfamily domain-containing protein n=1 Tax=Crucibulum laeve TaxID=68775 RepID=A0A5C3LT52_9AGAR|nr:major facilitator superfamily domain-containing protein [Crucibulum laeve]